MLFSLHVENSTWNFKYATEASKQASEQGTAALSVCVECFNTQSLSSKFTTYWTS